MSKLKKIIETRISNLDGTSKMFLDMGNEAQAKTFREKKEFLESILADASVEDTLKIVGLRE